MRPRWFLRATNLLFWYGRHFLKPVPPKSVATGLSKSQHLLVLAFLKGFGKIEGSPRASKVASLGSPVTGAIHLQRLYFWRPFRPGFTLPGDGRPPVLLTVPPEGLNRKSLATGHCGSSIRLRQSLQIAAPNGHRPT